MKFNLIDVPALLQADSEQWQSWTWQMKNSLSTYEQVQRFLDLNESERNYFANLENSGFKFRMNPYSLSLMSQLGVYHPLRKIFLGTDQEFNKGLQSQLDPLGENKHRPTPRIIHRYSDRALFLVTDFCSVYCRYCTRKHFTGKDQVFPNKSDYENALDYIRSQVHIREVILSGGDPLTLSDSRLEKIMTDLRQIKHIEIIRVGTRMPVVMPMRVTEDLVKKLKRFHPVYIMTHFNHPDELTKQSVEALKLWVDHGFPVMNQMVLLNGVNNHPALVQALNRRLLYFRVKPYYMFQCDPSEGTDHLRTSIQNSLDIQKELWGHMSGLSMPHLSVDIPSGGGKAYLVPNFIKETHPSHYSFEGWDGVKENYINPTEESLLFPQVDEKYILEWEGLKSSKPEAKI